MCRRYAVDQTYRSFLLTGIALIALGFALIALPLIAKSLPTDARWPKILVYVYHRGNFYFVTSPLLIAVSLAYLAYLLWRSTRG